MFLSMLSSVLSSYLILSAEGNNRIESTLTTKIGTRSLPATAGTCDGIALWTKTDVSTHPSTECLWILYDTVFDLTSFASKHKGGSSVINGLCGQDGTGPYETKHNDDELDDIKNLKIGVIANGSADPCGDNYDTNNPTLFLDDGGDGGFSLSDIFSWCFTRDSTVEVKDKGPVAMKDLNIGDQVLVDTNNKYEYVYSLGHKDPDLWVSYLQITTKHGNTLEISKDHLIFVKDKGTIPALNVEVGDKLYLSIENDIDEVHHIKSIVRKGAYAPFTPSGTIVVNGIKTSTFVTLQEGLSELQIGGRNIGLSFHYLSYTFELPHRLWCQLLSCENETYIDGISIWSIHPYKIVLWFLNQNNGIILIVGSILFFLSLSLLGLFNVMLSNPTLLLYLALSVGIYILRIRATSTNDV